MDLYSLHYHHRIALSDISDAPNAEARRWAGECADYYATRIVALRRKMETSGRTLVGELAYDILHMRRASGASAIAHWQAGSWDPRSSLRAGQNLSGSQS